MTEQLLNDDFALLADKITRDTAFRCASYKDKCLRRRIAVRMRARGAESYLAYATLLDQDGREYQKLLDALTVNVTRFFRNASVYDAIARQIVPRLWAGDDDVAAWSAGTASGEEAYSLAALFYEHAARTGTLSTLGRVSVTGTDIDRASLAAAERAVYAPAAFVETDESRLEALFRTTHAGRTVVPTIRALARFERRDLLSDAPPPASFDLITCRNVIIYLDRDAQESLLESFFEALKPGGYLVLGRVETLLGKPRRLFAPVDIRERIYRRER